MLSSPLTILVWAAAAVAHIQLVYPGTRGNNLITNKTFPYGMQWIYPCGGMGTSRNRTYWPTVGGAVAFQPGWFQGHETAFAYINLGFGTDGPDDGPPNMSHIMQPVWQITGPSQNPYPGTICLPQVPLPAGAKVKPGDKATIQVVMLALHGAALYSCVDIIFAEPHDPRIAEVNETNCFNSSGIGSADVFTITTRGATTVDEDSGSSSLWFYSRTRKLSWWRSALIVVPLFAGALWLFS